MKRTINIPRLLYEQLLHLKISDLDRLETRIALRVNLTELINFLHIVMSPCKKIIECYLIFLNNNKIKIKSRPDS